MRRVIHAALTAFLLLGGFSLACLAIRSLPQIESDTVITAASMLLVGCYLAFEDFVAPSLAAWKQMGQDLHRG